MLKSFSSLILVILLLFPNFASSQEEELEPKAKPQARGVKLGDITKNIHFILDFSGSMHFNEILAAIDQTLKIAEINNDEYNIAVTVFGKHYLRWKGEGNNWISLPSADNLNLLRGFLSKDEKNVKKLANIIDDNYTSLQGPLTTALSEFSESNKDLTIIIISDLAFDDPDHYLLNIIEKHKEQFIKNSRILSVGFISLGSSDRRLERISEICLKTDSWLEMIK